MELQHLNAKLLVQNPEQLELEPLIPIFHSWIQDQVCAELLLDVADYRHVEAGPGVVLIGHQADYSVDNTDHRLGVRYNRKAPLNGGNPDRLRQALRAALTATQRLQSEPSVNGRLRFNGRDIELFVNDRLLAPNTEATRQALEPEFRAFFDEVLRGSEYDLEYQRDPRRLFTAYVRTARPFAVSELLKSLSK